MKTLARWWRFEAYDLDNDGRIVPTPGAKLVAVDLETGKPPGLSYGALLKLAAELRASSTGQQQRELILDWCKSYGLLGLLPQRVRVMGTAPTWERHERYPEAPWLVKTQRRYVRAGGIWDAQLLQSTTPFRIPGAPRRGDVRERPYDVDIEGSLVAHLDEDELYLEPYVLFQDALEKEPISTLAELYFADAGSNASGYPYPRPLTEEFWRRYSEKEEDVVRAILSFERIIGERRQSKYGPLESRETELNSLLQGANLCFTERTDLGSATLSVQVPSLLSYLALEAAQSLSSGNEPMICESCSKPFIAKRHGTLYCSPKCRSRMQKVHQRANSAKNL